MRHRLPLPALIAILIAAGGAFFFIRLTFLHIKNMENYREIRIRIGSDERFSMFYINSIYRQPVTEEFQAGKDGILLKGVRTKSAGVMEYYGFQDIKEFHPMDLGLGPAFFIRGGMEGQGLVVRGRKIYLSEIGEKGSRIQLQVESVSLGAYILSMFKKD